MTFRTSNDIYMICN